MGLYVIYRSEFVPVYGCLGEIQRNAIKCICAACSHHNYINQFLQKKR